MAVELRKSLQAIGLKEKEASAYIALLRLVEANAHQIAAEANLERTTIYQIMTDLCGKGLVHRIVKGKRYFYVAESLDALEYFVKNKYSILENMKPLLAGIAGSQSKKPVVKYYDNLPDIKKVFEGRTDSKEKLVRDFVFVNNVIEVFGKRFIYHQIEKRVANKIHVRSLRRGPMDEDMQDDWYISAKNNNLLRKVRYLNPNFTFDEPLITIYDQTVGIFSSKRELSALIIESHEFSRAMKVLFDIAWATAKK